MPKRCLIYPHYALLMLTGLGLLLSTFSLNAQKPTPTALHEEIPFQEDVFKPGEIISYRVHYGFINGGTANLQIIDKLYKVNDRPCYKVAVEGRSSRAMNMIVKIRDQWVTYMDTTHYLPQKAYRFIREGKFSLDEVTTYNQEKGQAHVVQKKRDKEWKLEFEKVAYDMVSGYYFLRRIDYNKIPKGDTITVDAVFEDKFYNIRVRYVGKETIKTKFGKVKSIKLVPIMPENSLFDGEESIRFWISDDRNKIPVKVEADMFVGAVELDIKGYRNLRYPFEAE